MRTPCRSVRLGLALVAVVLYGLNMPTIGHATGGTGTTTSVSISSTHNPSGYGELIVLDAHVSSAGSGTPTGTVTFFDGATSLGSGNVSSFGQAALAQSTLPLGAHNITAVYNGDAVFAGSTSGILIEQVNTQGTTTLTLSTVNPAVFGTNVVILVIVNANAGTATPTGSVTLTDGGTLLGILPLDSGGSGAFATKKLAVGSHPMTASYPGDGNFTSSVDTSLTETITKTTSATTLTPSANPSSWNSALTLTAAVTNPAGTVPTGTVSFSDGSTGLGSVALDGSGHAALTTSSLAPGSHSIVATYGGDGSETGSASAPLSETIAPAATAVAASSSANPDIFGDALTLSVDVTSGAGVPSGTVALTDNGAALGTVTLDASGHGGLTTSSLAVGTHPIRASYAGNTFFAAATSSVLSQTINTDPTSVALVSSLNPSGFGSTVTFTATVSSPHGVPVGVVQFFDGSTLLGSFPPNAGGTASLSTSGLDTGTHPITAFFTGDANDAPSTSPVLNQTVNALPSVTTVASSLNPANAAQAVTITATVTSAKSNPTGTVTFLDGATVLSSAAVDGSGHAALTLSALSVGSHTITANYSGDKRVKPSSASLIETITSIPTSTSLASSLNPSTFGSSVTFTATVSSTFGGSPTGTVTFSDGTTVLGTAAVSGGTAALTISSLTVGIHSITASYGGDARFGVSASDVLGQQVTTIPTTTTLTSSLNPATYATPVTFTATVSSVSGTPGGTVTFFDGATSLGTVGLSGGTAQLTIGTLGLGAHSVTAVYSGAPTYGASSGGPLSEQVNQAVSTTSLVSSANPSTFGSPLTFTATVTSAAGTPTGSITFSDGAAVLATVTLSGGAASLSPSTLTGGVHSVTAAYSGDTLSASSTSNVVAEAIGSAATQTALIGAPNPVALGGTATFTAAVTSGAGTPLGAVAFRDGATLLGTMTTDATGTATLATSALTAGDHAITAQFLGTNNYAASTSPALTEWVNVATQTALTSSANPAAAGSPVTFTASVTASAGTAAGSVQFLDGATVLSTVATNGSGLAAFSTSALAAGSHAMTAQFVGNNSFAGSTSPVVTEQVNNPTQTSLISSLNPSNLGAAVTFTATVTSGGGTPAGAVTFLDGSKALGTVVTGPTGSAALTIATLGAGAHSITAQFVPNANFFASTSSALAEQINNPTQTTVSSSLNPSMLGAAVTFTATVSSAAGAPQGSVQFNDGGSLMGTATSNSSGVATFTTSALTAGSHSVTAQFVSGNNFAGSAASLTQVVTAPTSTALASSLNPSTTGTAVTFTATVTSTGGAPQGSVRFLDGATVLGTVATNASGVAAFTTSALALGTHSVTATFVANGSFAGSTSTALSQRVLAGTSTALTSSLNPATAGAAVTFTAKVTSAAGTPTGSVQFLDGATVLGTVAASSTGTATLTTSTLASGTHSITAHFVPTGNFGPSTSAPVSEQIGTHRTECPPNLRWIDRWFGRGACDPDARWWRWFVDWLRDHHLFDRDPGDRDWVGVHLAWILREWHEDGGGGGHPGGTTGGRGGDDSRSDGRAGER